MEREKRGSVEFSRRRFEEWMDSISPCVSPSIPASRPSTALGDSVGGDSSEVVSSNGSGRSRVSTVVTRKSWELSEEDEIATVRMVGLKRAVQEGEGKNGRRCGECGRGMLSEFREWGVQTDISCRLIVF